jgi:phage shock protein C
MTNTAPTQAPYKQLRRPTTDRMVAGVASGLGRYFGVDPTLVRVVFAVVVVLTGGFALLAYPIMWFLMPEEPADAPPWPNPGPAPGGPIAPPAGQAAGPQAPSAGYPAGPQAPPAA